MIEGISHITFIVKDLERAAMFFREIFNATENHIAFKIKEEDFEKYIEKIEELGLEFKPPRQRVEGEGRSLYFYDFDNHLFELHTGTLDERLKKYSSIKQNLKTD